jgi:hypothetical protein
MKKNIILRVLTITLLTLLSIFVLSLIIWFVKPKNELKVFILNKTVPTQQRYDHRALTWVLNHEKYVKSDNTLYNLYQDYHGFYPIDKKNKEFEFKSLSLSDISIVADTSDIVYYADTYGVYYNDWYKEHMKIEPEQKVFGGMNQNDYLLLKKMKEKKKAIITEFVLLNNPTSDLIRTKTEDLFDFEWEGWVGRYFSNLDTTKKESVPEWIVDLYMEQNGQKWTYNNDGVVLIHEYGKVIVLENGQHLNSPFPIIYTQEKYRDKYHLPDRINYSYWFDIVSTGSSNDVVSEFRLNTTTKGDSILRESRLSGNFPAVLSHTTDYTFYYFAGDFADNTIRPSISYFYGIEVVSSILSSNKSSNSEHFFFNYYNPLMKNILYRTRNVKSN